MKHGGPSRDENPAIYQISQKPDIRICLCSGCIAEIGGREDKPEDIDEDGNRFN
jgi:hypothetical protein